MSDTSFRCLECGVPREIGEPCPNDKCPTKQAKPASEPESELNTTEAAFEAAAGLVKEALGVDFKRIREIAPKLFQFCKDSGLSKTETLLLLDTVSDKIREHLQEAMKKTEANLHTCMAVVNDDGSIDIRAVDGHPIPEAAKQAMMEEAKALVERMHQQKAESVLKRCREQGRTPGQA